MYMTLIGYMENMREIDRIIRPAIYLGAIRMVYSDNPFNPIYAHPRSSHIVRMVPEDVATLIFERNIFASKFILN